MADPATVLANTIGTAVVLPTVTLFGVSLGLRADLLVAGFAGALVAVILLNSVPSTGDTWRALVRTALRRITVVLASSLTAGYMAPLVLVLGAVPDIGLLGSAFIVGAGAQKIVAHFIARFSGGAA